ncbi:MAG TPA: amino acid permease [Acidimicrobiales bacterium]|jgi:amino acid transporter|nr:amino acid permease [Acidimicrobiales bacterium]
MAAAAAEYPESFGYRFKRKLLGPPLVTEALEGERLSKPIAMGVLTCDMISSAAYGTEEMLTVLVPAVGAAAFALVLPVTLAILLVLTVVTLSYREVVMVYTKAGGSYVVARENFGVYVAQFAAVALIVDYTLTVAVQSAAGTAALGSAFPSLGTKFWQTLITTGIVLVLIWGNLRGIREAGRIFAFPTYFFIAAILLVVVVGLIRVAAGDLHHVAYHADHIKIGTPGGGLLQGLSVFYLLRSFANGGSSLTGLEAISNSVSVFHPPEGRNARRVLALMSLTLGVLVLGVSLLAHYTRAIPYQDGTPTVISQVAKAAFGSGFVGQVGFYVVQLATLLILWTGANTSFNGFPFLANFVAEDRFMPRPFMKRGHRLVFSNGIIFLGVVAVGLILITRAQVDSLVSLYAIGVFCGFTMAGLGMAKHHATNKESGWRHKLAINGTAGVVSFVVVIIFAVTKFTQGAWAVVVLIPIGMYGLIRTHRLYTAEAQVLNEGAAEQAVAARPLPRHVAFVLVDSLDLATARVIQYARTLSVDDIRAVHVVLDSRRAQRIQDRWVRLGLSRLPLQLIHCPDRRVDRAIVELVTEAVADQRTEVSVLMPRRAYGAGLRRLLHDGFGDRIATAISRIEHVNATIVPFDVRGELNDLRRQATTGPTGPDAESADIEEAEEEVDERVFENVSGTTPISALQPRQTAKVAGRVKSVTVRPWGDTASLQVELTDDQGVLTCVFLGRRQIAGLVPGSRIVAEGTVATVKGHPGMINPHYEFAADPQHETAGAE